MPSDATRDPDDRRARDEAIAEALMIPFSVVVGDVLRHRAPEMLLPDRNQPVQTFFFDRPHETFRVSVRIGRALRCEDHAETRLLESPPHITAPLAIPVADQHRRCVDHTILGHRQCAGDLLHEQCLGMRRGSEDLHAAGSQVDDEHRVVRDQTAPRPHFGREEIGASNRAPMRFQIGVLVPAALSIDRDSELKGTQSRTILSSTTRCHSNAAPLAALGT